MGKSEERCEEEWRRGRKTYGQRGHFGGVCSGESDPRSAEGGEGCAAPQSDNPPPYSFCINSCGSLRSRQGHECHEVAVGASQQL
jgi:hypothetical protein